MQQLVPLPELQVNNENESVIQKINNENVCHTAQLSTIYFTGYENHSRMPYFALVTIA